MTRKEALQLVTDWTKNQNLVKHMLCVEAEMRALAKHFGEDEELWGLVGLLHDADYEMFKNDPKTHPSKIFEELESRNVDTRIIAAIKAHAWGHSHISKEPENNLEWSIYAADELSGFIVACALVTPNKKLLEVTIEKMKKNTFYIETEKDGTFSVWCYSYFEKKHAKEQERFLNHSSAVCFANANGYKHEDKKVKK